MVEMLIGSDSCTTKQVLLEGNQCPQERKNRHKIQLYQHKV